MARVGRARQMVARATAARPRPSSAQRQRAAGGCCIPVTAIGISMARVSRAMPRGPAGRVRPIRKPRPSSSPSRATNCPLADAPRLATRVARIRAAPLLPIRSTTGQAAAGLTIPGACCRVVRAVYDWNGQTLYRVDYDAFVFHEHHVYEGGDYPAASLEPASGADA